MKRKCKQCSAKPHGKVGYCLRHLPNELRCKMNTRRGTQCKLPAVDESGICQSHINSTMRGQGSGRFGWVYVFDTKFIHDGYGVYKIGRSLDPKSREGELRAGNPFGEMLFAGNVGSHAKDVEAQYHKRLIHGWIEREMFAIPEREIEQIKSELRSLSTNWMEEKH